MSRGALKLRELQARLKTYGVIVLEGSGSGKRGKGSEIILLKPNSPESRQGPQYPVKNHRPGTAISP